MTLHELSNKKNESQKTDSDLNNLFHYQKVAFLVSTGFTETDFSSTQKILRSAGAVNKIISTDTGLVTSWQKEQWGHNYAVDLPVNKALAADFSMCILPGGERSVNKLGVSAHTKRILNGFLSCFKPVLAINEGADLLRRYAKEQDISLDLSSSQCVNISLSDITTANTSGEQAACDECKVTYINNCALVSIPLNRWNDAYIKKVLCDLGEYITHPQAA